MVFLLTDGAPTDEWEEAVDSFRAGNLATVIACAAGTEARDDVLKRLSDTVLRLQDTQPGTLTAFMKWVTMSVTATSKTQGTRATREEMLPDLPEDEGIVLVP